MIVLKNTLNFYTIIKRDTYKKIRYIVIRDPTDNIEEHYIEYYPTKSICTELFCFDRIKKYKSSKGMYWFVVENYKNFIDENLENDKILEKFKENLLKFSEN